MRAVVRHTAFNCPSLRGKSSNQPSVKVSGIGALTYYKRKRHLKLQALQQIFDLLVN
jgi:hypothetical protein